MEMRVFNEETKAKNDINLNDLTLNLTDLSVL